MDYDNVVRSITREFDRRKQSDTEGKFRDFEEVYAEYAVTVVLGTQTPWCRDQVRERLLSGNLCAESLRQIIKEAKSRAGGKMLDEERVRKQWELDAIAEINTEIDGFKADLARRMNEILGRWEGGELWDLAAKQRLCSIIMEVAEKIDRLFRCERCGRPARVRAVKTLKEENGQFQFVHTKGHRTTHQVGARIPRLKLIEENK